MTPDYFVGLDLGKTRDYTALVVVERQVRTPRTMDWVAWEMKRGEPEVRYEVRWAERVPLKTPYPAVVRRVAEVVGQLPAGTRQALVVDGTGAGAPVTDYLRDAKLGQCAVVPVSLTAGGKAHLSEGTWFVPKEDLVAALRMTLEERTLRIARGLREGRALEKELREFRVRRGAGGEDRYGRAGIHDDLVMAAALACWRARLRRGTPNPAGAYFAF